MASNITEIGNAINNLNLTFQNITTDNILQTAIQNTNNNSGNWIGILLFIIMCGSIFIYIIKNKSGFSIFDQFGLIFISMSIWLDLGIYLLIWGILASFQIYIFLLTIFFILCFFSQIKKDMLNTGD